jgi:phage baseplate assembly protein W
MTLNVFTPVQKKISLYSDFKKDLEVNLLTDDVSVLRDEDSVKEAIRNLLMTDRGERLMQPNLGAGLRQLLFENMIPSTFELIKERVKSTLEIYEPRADIIDITVSGSLDEGSVFVNIVFFINNREQPITLDVILERTR